MKIELSSKFNTGDAAVYIGTFRHGQIVKILSINYTRNISGQFKISYKCLFADKAETSCNVDIIDEDDLMSIEDFLFLLNKREA